MSQLIRTLYFYDHQGKGAEYIKALQLAGFRFAGPSNASVIMMDYNTPARIKLLHSRLASGRARLFIYPHAACPNVGWDGLIEQSRHVSGIFVSAKGHIEILRKIGVQNNITVAGWSYCQQSQFAPNPNPARILFAPIHPSKRGFLSSVDAKLNKAAFQRLTALKSHFEITVRHVGTLESNYLPRIGDIRYTQAQTDLYSSSAQIAENDVIVGRGTIAYMAVAMGKPTVMIGENVPPRNGSEMDLKYVSNFELYKDLFSYPLDILTENDTMGLILRSAISDSEIADWRDRMIGNPFDHKVVADTILNCL